MADEIELSRGEIERTYNGKSVRTSKEQLSRILAPMFATFQGLSMSDETFSMYHKLLADLDPNKLAAAVMISCGTHKYPTQLITVASIREAYDGEERMPGPRNDIDMRELKPVPTKMFHLEPDEDKQQRLERLRQTKGWGKLYQ